MSRKQDFERKCVETLAEKSIFEKTKYFIVDMDGTFYLDGNIIPGADGFLKKVRESGRDFYFFTNNSSNNVASCRNKLAKMGFPVDEKRVIISSHVTIDFLKRHRPGKSVYLLGNERLTGDFEAAGINLVEKDPDIVVLGFDTTLTYQKLWDAEVYRKRRGVYSDPPRSQLPDCGRLHARYGLDDRAFRRIDRQTPACYGQAHDRNCRLYNPYALLLAR